MSSLDNSKHVTVLDKIQIFDGFLDQSTIQEMYRNLFESKWMIHYSDRNRKDSLLFAHNLADQKYFTETLFKKILLKLDCDYEIMHVYANGQYYGMPGRPHADEDRTKNDESDYLTFLIYINPMWDFLWGGQTILFNRYNILSNDGIKLVILNDDVKVIYPKPGRAIMFPSYIIHYAESPTKDCFDFRITVAYKLKKIL